MAEVAAATSMKDANGTRQEAKVEDLIKIVEDLTRIHWKIHRKFNEKFTIISRKNNEKCYVFGKEK